MIDYSFLYNKKTAAHWNKIGIKRRAGVVVPLFSVRSKSSIGIGEIPDIKFLIKWCEKTGISILQLLPLNDTGYDFAPYNSLSSYALDPMYLSLQSLKEVNLDPFKKEIRELRNKYFKVTEKVDYNIKQDKINLLWRIYKRTYTNGIKKFHKFIESNREWLIEYATFKVLKLEHNNINWEKFPECYKNKNNIEIKEFVNKQYEKITFHYWLQWQLFLQMSAIKKYAKEKNILLMGDIPFLVSRDSADVWANQEFFKLNLMAGAPPDMYFANGQRWGMPPYDMKVIERESYRYFINKLNYASNFYDLYRIDHFVGIFRLWTIDISTPEEKAGLSGKYDPENPELWEDNGKKFLESVLNECKMLPCAEDLGTVPECSPRVLWDYGIPGIDVQRWLKKNNEFISSDLFRWLCIASISTHDSSCLVDWWHNEAGTIDGKLFERLLKEKGFDEKYINLLKEKLFDISKSHYNRLYWKDEVSSREILSDMIGLPIDKMWDIVILFDESYKEKDKFIKTVLNGSESELNGKITKEFIEKVLRFISETDSIFQIQLIQEYLCLDENFIRKMEEKSFRINFPGIVNDENWTLILPIYLEYLLNLECNSDIRKMNEEYQRI